MKILTDFDGVLTNPTEEAKRVSELFSEFLGARFSDDGHEPGLTSWLKQAEGELRRNAHLYGWKSQGRISAFADEDPFVKISGLAGALNGLALSAPDSPSTQTPDFFESLVEQAYKQMTSETRAGIRKPLEPAAARTLARLLHEGHEIVVVSNSASDRILAMIAGAETGALTPALRTGQLRIRGDARKFQLGPESQGFAIGRYFVETARPRYEAILREEKPDCVIGDVLSLDLSLPYALALGTEKPMTLLLRVRDYTPAWSKSFVRDASRQARFALLTEFQDLPSVLS